MFQPRPVSLTRPSISLIILLAAGVGVARSAGLEFRLFRSGEEIGSESCTVTPEPQGGAVTVSATATLELSGRPVAMSQSLRVDEDSFALRDYRLAATVQGDAQSITAIRIPDSVIVEITAGAAHLRRSFPAGGDVLVLDNLMMNHLVLLAMRSARRGFEPETVQVVVPQVGVLMSAAVTPQPAAPDGSRKIDVRIGTVTESIRLDPGGETVGAEIPAQGLRFERVVPEGAAQAARPAPPRATVERSIPEATATPTRVLYEEQPVTFPAQGSTLDGFLTVPRGGQKIPYPAVVFVHRSGAQDRDGSTGPNQPFYEIARGLAVMGIASLRYDKRPLAEAGGIRATVQGEVIDDAVAALDFLRSQATIDTRRIWILGHELGGSLAPTIARADRRVAGLVVLGGSLRPLDEILRDRILRASGLTGREGTQAGAVDPDDRLILAQLDSLAAGTLPGKRTIEGWSAHYLTDYRSRDLASDLTAFKGPILLLFGEKDDQIFKADIDSWTKVVSEAGMRNVTTRMLPGLGPLFIPIHGEPSPEALTIPGHVDPAVIDQIADFILSPP